MLREELMVNMPSIMDDILGMLPRTQKKFCRARKAFLQYGHSEEAARHGKRPTQQAHAVRPDAQFPEPADAVEKMREQRMSHIEPETCPRQPRRPLSAQDAHPDECQQAGREERQVTDEKSSEKTFRVRPTESGGGKRHQLGRQKQQSHPRRNAFHLVRNGSEHSRPPRDAEQKVERSEWIEENPLPRTPPRRWIQPRDTCRFQRCQNIDRRQPPESRFPDNPIQ